MKKLSGLLIIAAIAAISIKYFKNTPGKAALRDCENCNLVVILVDTLRADHLPFYGYKFNTTPFLSRLADKSTVFERGFSASSWTAPATASVFTGVLPSVHGVITGFQATQSQKRRNASIELNRIPDDFETLGEFASRLGFETIGVADNLNIGNEIGFDRGFKYFTKYRYRGAEAINRRASEFLKKIPVDKPYFLYLHYMEPHEPNSKREPWFSECMEKLPERNMKKAICAYNSEISYLDSKLEEMFKRYSWEENSIVIFLSDHGEEFKDHGHTGHGKSLYTEMIHVPFFVYHPEWQAARIPENVHTYDILPTLAALVETADNPKWQGNSLLPLLSKAKSENTRLIVSERLRSPASRFTWSKRSVVLQDLHLIKTSFLDSDDVEFELYDLKEDLAEKNDLSAHKADELSKLSELLDRNSLNEKDVESQSVSIEADEETLRELKTLGYID